MSEYLYITSLYGFQENLFRHSDVNKSAAHQQLLVQRQREGEVDDGEVVDGQAAEDAHQLEVAGAEHVEVGLGPADM